jgi:hypothetical protein
VIPLEQVLRWETERINQIDRLVVYPHIGGFYNIRVHFGAGPPMDVGLSAHNGWPLLSDAQEAALNLSAATDGGRYIRVEEGPRLPLLLPLSTTGLPDLNRLVDAGCRLLCAVAAWFEAQVPTPVAGDPRSEAAKLGVAYKRVSSELRNLLAQLGDRPAVPAPDKSVTDRSEPVPWDRPVSFRPRPPAVTSGQMQAVPAATSEDSKE